MVDIVLQIMGWLGALVVLVGYYKTSKRQDPRPFDTANVYGTSLMAPVNMYYGLYFALLLNLVFGGLAVYSILQRTTLRRWLHDWADYKG